MRVDPRGLDLEQARELAGVWGQDGGRVSLDRLEAEEPVGVHDRGQVGLRQ